MTIFSLNPQSAPLNVAVTSLIPSLLFIHPLNYMLLGICLLIIHYLRSLCFNTLQSGRRQEMLYSVTP